MDAWVASYVGVPFLEHGRDRQGWDCWGLARHVLGRHYAKSVPSFDVPYAATDGAEIGRLIDTSRPLVPTSEVLSPDAGDLVLLRLWGKVCHVGVYVGEGMLLHALPGIGTVLERLDGVRLRNRVEGFYRVL